MEIQITKPKAALNKAFLKVKPNRSDIEKFKTNLKRLIDHIDDSESEEFHKNIVTDFLKKTYYDPDHFINTKGRNDQVIHIGNTAKTPVGVIIEAKKYSNKNEMVSARKLNAKAFQELVLYYLRERITHKNLEIKHLVVTNIYEWYIFDAVTFDRLFAQNKNFVKQFEDFEAGRLADTKTDFFYKQVAEPFISSITSEINFTYFDLHDYEKPLRNEDKKDDTKLIALFKLLSPENLLKQPFANDSNSLDKRFYSELLHIIGLTETKEGGKKLIGRKPESQRDSGSLLEDTILQLDTIDLIGRMERPSQFGATHQERLFNVALELSITWINRVLFLKLLEAQLVSYHKGDRSYAFLNFATIKNYDDLNTLFFQVLAKKHDDRNDDVKALFSKVPYLNSSLFEPTELEYQSLRVSNLRDEKTLAVLSSTVLKDANGKKVTGSLTTLEYLFRFLDAYDFSGEGQEEIQEDNKTLINASVLGLIFEKINGYKDGSFFTPGFITMYMCRETIRKAVVQKFNETKSWDCSSIEEVYDKISDRKEANEIVNSIHICDPAVGSGHFLVSALNEMIAIKNDLKILSDRDGKRLKEYNVEVVNDELVVTDDEGELFEYHPSNKESQRVQEALFHEKHSIIENCLFGVDINPNSVKICRLRLWIELLKNAYYKNATELETLPNIDINIKCGNSLVSRFAIDADLKQALKKSKWSIDSYRLAVDTYRNATSKEQKREMEKLIADIKSDFRSEISNNDPKLLKYRKLSGELYNLTNQQQLFDLGKKEKASWNKQVAKLTQETKALEAEIEEIKANKIYENAFEWRFEFPEVLDDEGNFVGFDVVIGNPPYGVNLSLAEKLFYKNNYSEAKGEIEIYALFIELGISQILRNAGFFSYITTNTIYYLDKFAQVRINSFLSNNILSLLELEKQVFADAPDIIPAVYVIQKKRVENAIVKLLKAKTTKSVYDLSSFSYFSVNSIEQGRFAEKRNATFNLEMDDEKGNLLGKLSSFDPLNLRYKTIYGIKTGDNSRFVSQTITDNGNWQKCVSSAKNISKYLISWNGDYLNVVKELAGLGNVNYKQPKILIQYIRKLSMPVRLVCALDQNGDYYPLNNFSFIVSDKQFSLIFLLGLLNSKLMNWYFTNTYVDYNIKPKYIEQLPLPKVTGSTFLETLVEQILDERKVDSFSSYSAIQSQIDQLVYKLYNLTDDEIAIVENSFK